MRATPSSPVTGSRSASCRRGLGSAPGRHAAPLSDPTDLTRIYVDGAHKTQVPLSAVTKVERGLQPQVIPHQGQFPSATLSFNLAEDG